MVAYERAVNTNELVKKDSEDLADEPHARSLVQFFLDGETLIGVGFDLQRFFRHFFGFPDRR